MAELFLHQVDQGGLLEDVVGHQQDEILAEKLPGLQDGDTVGLAFPFIVLNNGYLQVSSQGKFRQELFEPFCPVPGYNVKLLQARLVCSEDSPLNQRQSRNTKKGLGNPFLR